jgi:hypothetical protein
VTDPWRVMCRVSGGVTGTRGPTPLRSGGREARFPTFEAADAHARALLAGVSPHATCRFEYWAEKVGA